MAEAKQQFNIYLAPQLILAMKHRAIDEQTSLSELVGRFLHYALAGSPMSAHAAPTDAEALVLQPMIHVENVSATVSFFEALGADVVAGSRDGDFVQLRIGGAEIGVLGHPPNPEQHEGAVELNFECRGDLHALGKRLKSAGVRIVQDVSDEAFGKQLQIATPDGILVKVNELDPRTFQ